MARRPPTTANIMIIMVFETLVLVDLFSSKSAGIRRGAIENWNEERGKGGFVAWHGLLSDLGHHLHSPTVPVIVKPEA